MCMLEWIIICPQIVDFMENSRAGRLFKERRDSLMMGFNVLRNAFLEFRSSHVADGEIYPSLIDICLEPEVQSVLDDGLNNKSRQDLHDELLPFFPSICARWRESIESRLLERMSSSNRFRKRGNQFTLASVIFKCTTCGDALQYPAVLTHGCLNAVIPNSTSNDYPDVAAYVYRRQPWSADVLDLTSWSGLISKVIHLCGFNPKTATCDQMDQTRARLTCKSCNRNGRRTIMTWRAAVSLQASSKVRRNPNTSIVGSFDHGYMLPSV